MSFSRYNLSKCVKMIDPLLAAWFWKANLELKAAQITERVSNLKIVLEQNVIFW